jgi:hypothetical protein
MPNKRFETELGKNSRCSIEALDFAMSRQRSVYTKKLWRMQVSRGLHEPYGRRALHTGAFHNLPQPPRPRKRLGLAYAGKIVRDGHLVGLRHRAIYRVTHDAHSPALLVERVVCPAPHPIVSHNVPDEHSNQFYLPSEPRLNKLVCLDAGIAIGQSSTWDAVWKRLNCVGSRFERGTLNRTCSAD